MTVIIVVIGLYRVGTNSERPPLLERESVEVQVSADITVMLFATCFCSRLIIPM